jgi:hypothetical protein
MKEKITLLLLLFCVIHSSLNYAEPKKLQSYDCPSLEDAKVCSGSCSINKRYQIALRANDRESSVTWFLFEDGNLKTSKTIKECNIFNNDNWICESNIKPEFKDLVGFFTSGMNNGIYWNESHYREQNFKDDRYSCYK